MERKTFSYDIVLGECLVQLRTGACLLPDGSTVILTPTQIEALIALSPSLLHNEHISSTKAARTCTPLGAGVDMSEEKRQLLEELDPDTFRLRIFNLPKKLRACLIESQKAYGFRLKGGD